MEISLSISGRPAPKGSAQAFARRGGGRPILVPGGSRETRERMLAWGDAVRDAALVERARASRELIPRERGVVVAIVFRLDRPRAHYRTGKRSEELRDDAPLFHVGKPDADKLTRTTLDALSGVLFADDAQVAPLAAKIYAAPPAVRPADAGAWILIAPLEGGYALEAAGRWLYERAAIYARETMPPAAWRPIAAANGRARHAAAARTEEAPEEHAA